MKRGYIILFFFFLFIQVFGQFEKIKGNWISINNEMLSIQDSIKSDNYLTNMELQNDKFYLELNVDTISFQSRYYLSSDDYKKLHTNNVSSG